MKRLLFILALPFLFTSCKKKEETAPTPDLSLTRSSYSDLKNWNNDYQEEAFQAFLASCGKIEKENKPFLPIAEIKVSTRDYQSLCQKAKKIKPQDFKKFIEQNFTPWLVSWKGSPEGKFTSYYESELHASKTQSEKYKYPIYGRPDNLIEVNLQQFDKNLPAKRLVGKVEGNRLVPYDTREEIYNKGAQAPVILWGDDYIDIYIMQIQGSAVAKLDDGSRQRIAFADTNGREFKGIGSILLEQKLLKPGEASMLGIKKWLRKHPDVAARHMNKNQRYVFHRFNDATGPIGAQGVALTAGRSLAVDRQFIPLGTLLWLETAGPQKENIHKLVIAQDIGGAIKGAVRGDYFWGSGDDEILDLAGRMNSTGKYYIFLPNSQEAAQ